MTKRDYFVVIKNAIDSMTVPHDVDKSELRAFVEHEIAALDKRYINRKPSPKQRENETFKLDIFKYLNTTEKPSTFDSIYHNIPSLQSMSPQKVSGLIRSLVNDGKIHKSIDGKKAAYSL